MPELTITSQESAGAGTGVPTGTGAVGVAGTTDAGPPPTGPAYVHCQSLQDFVNNFGPRSAVSAPLYDFLDEFFHDGGVDGYVVRVTDATATTASLTLNDGQSAPKPTILVSALTPGAEGNNTFVTVAVGTNPTFTATTVSSSPNLSAISSFKNLGVGTPITGTGIPAGTYIVSVNTGAGTAVMSQNASVSGSNVVITPGTITVTITVEDGSGNEVATEEHGPYYTTAQLIADTTSTWVTFAQSAQSGNTQNLPAVLAQTALTGGADASDLTDTSYVNALASLPATLGPMSIALPGKTSPTCWQGIQAHVNANNRFGILDMADNASAASVVSQVNGLGAGDWSRCVFVQGSPQLPPLTSGAARVGSGSSCVAALRAQVAATANQNQAPIATRWPLKYPRGFTTFFGPIPAGQTNSGTFSQADVNTMEAAGINCFANYYGVLCLFGFVTPENPETEPVFDQASASCERMALTADIQKVLANYVGVTIDGQNAETTQMHTDVVGVCQEHWQANGLYGASATDAYAVKTDSPVNTPQTAQAGQLNVQVQAKFCRFADKVNGTIIVVPVTGVVVQEVQQ